MYKRSLCFLVLVFAAFSQTRIRLAEWAIVLEDEPVARRVESRAALLGSEGRAHVGRIRSAQSMVIAEIRQRGITVTGATQMMVNAVTVEATREAAAELAKMPGVKYVSRLPRLKPALDRASQAANVGAAWAALGGSGQAGAGVKIGIIDSGMDLAHPGLQDPSMRAPAGFPTDTNAFSRNQPAYTNGKVIVARSYIADLAPGRGSERGNPNPVRSRPDDDTPRDHIGHGTAIAMIAAGASNTNTDGITIAGVAPKAYLGNYKIMGSPGLNDFTAFPALEHALFDATAVDRMDIVTLSLSEGDPAFYGPLDKDPQACSTSKDYICDAIVDAIETAVKRGTLVVVAAGNSGNIGKRPQTLTSIHSPGIAPSALTVGALENSRVMYQSVRTAGQIYRARSGYGPQLQRPVTALIRDVGKACSALPDESITGAIALIERGDCYIDEKINFAQRAGAVAAIVYQAEGDDILNWSLPATTTGIPALLVGRTDGQALRIVSGTVTIDPAYRATEAAGNTVWAASSRGPSPGDFGLIKTNVIKPEITAVGANIYTAAQRLDPSGDAYNASGYTSVSGTSYAVPMVAGAAALVKQKNPGFTPSQLKSALVNTADQNVLDRGSQASVVAMGAGKLAADRAAGVSTTVEPATVSFGALVPTTISDQRTITIRNHGAAAVTYNISVETRGGGLAPTVSPASVTVQPNGQSNSFSLLLSGARPAAGSYEGFVAISGGGQTLRVPYLYLVADRFPADVYVMWGGSFVGAPGDLGWEVALRVVDTYGVPVENLPVRFEAISGNGKIQTGDDKTYLLGISIAYVDLPSTRGEQVFRGTVGGPSGPFVEFFSQTRPYPDITAAGVVNAATNQPGIAPGAYVSIYGSDLADPKQVESTPYLPVTLSGVAVTFDVDGMTLPGGLHFVSPGQVNAQVPWELQGKSSVKVKVWRDYLQTDPVTVQLTPYAPGFFEVAGLAAAQDSGYGLITRANPAKRGGTVVLYANGLGPVTNQPASAEPTGGLSTTTSLPVVTVGGKAARVDFAGLTPGAVGLYQLNVTVAADTPTGDQQVVVSIGGVSSKASILPVQ